MHEEEWRVVVNHLKYEVSSAGRVRDRDTRCVLEPKLNRHGYLTVCLKNDNGRGAKTHNVYRLVAITFLPPDDSRECVNHIDGDKTNNRVENLRWATLSEQLHSRGRLDRSNTSGIAGVTWNKQSQKWQAQITNKGRTKHLGYFSMFEEARAARVKAARSLFGEYCSLIEKEETPPM